MRGKDAMESLKESGDGITPACAGKSCLNFFHAYSSKDHPRVCGEKMVSMIPHRRSRGSPPRMRGKEWYLQGESPAPGITPAYAGKSPVRSSILAAAVGSPPRMRGKAAGTLELGLGKGITPAYAGKS